MFEMSDLRHQMSEMQEQFAAQQKLLLESRAKLAALTVQTDSRDGRISVTLDSTGQISKLTFKDRSYQDLSPKELSANILELLKEANAEMQAKVAALMPRSTSGFSIDKLLDPKATLESFLPDNALGAEDLVIDQPEGNRHG